MVLTGYGFEGNNKTMFRQPVKRISINIDRNSVDGLSEYYIYVTKTPYSNI